MISGDDVRRPALRGAALRENEQRVAAAQLAAIVSGGTSLAFCAVLVLRDPRVTRTTVASVADVVLTFALAYFAGRRSRIALALLIALAAAGFCYSWWYHLPLITRAPLVVYGSFYARGFLAVQRVPGAS
ncbi:MAG: hypothetical protein ABJD07_02735 [Gemmatimonadaceae bacterium]